VYSRTFWLIALVVLLLVPGAMAFSVSSVTISPDTMDAGDPVNVTATVYAASGTSFSSYDDLQFVTALDDPIWVYTVIIDRVENTRPNERGKILTLAGYELSYPAKDEVIVRLSLKGQVPDSTATGSNISVLKVQELDARSHVITSTMTEYTHLVGMPTPTPTPAYGSITVSSNPRGATVYLDNTIRGITPMSLDAVPNGRHTVLLRAEGYADYTQDVSVDGGFTDIQVTLYTRTPTQTATPAATPAGAGATTAITGTGTPVSASTGSLSVTTSPVGALVYIDGKMKGISPATIPGLTPGTHTIRLILDGYQDLETTTDITAGTTSEFVTGLSKTKPTPGFEGAVVLAAVALLMAIRHQKTGKR